MEKILGLLEKRGLEIQCVEEYEHTDTPAGRVAVRRPSDEIRAIRIPLSSDEWCSLCMRDGENYIGGCCGQTGQTQDILNEIFRESGWVSADTAESLVLVAGSHDGFKILTEKDEEVLLKEEAGWLDLDPYGKIFLCVAAAKPRMKVRAPGRAKDLDDAEDIVWNLNKCSGYLSVKDLFARNPENKDSLHLGNRAVRVARMVPAAKAFLNHAKEIGHFPFEGFAIVDPNGKFGETMMGYAIFEKKKEAKDLLEAWQKDKDSKEIVASFAVRKVRITIEKGVEFIVG